MLMNNMQFTATRAVVSLVGAMLLLFSATTVFAATDAAATNESFTQGLQKDGGAVALDRSDPTNALGVPDGDFVSLGYGGTLIVGFNQNMSGNLLLTVQEVTGGSYPLETADVWVSTEPSGPWTYVGEATNDNGEGDEASSFVVNQCYQYVRLVDTTDSTLHSNSSDGFDVDAFTAEFDETCPEEPEPPIHYGPAKAYISLHSGSMIINETETAANTGGNMADGSYGGSAGSGGDIENYSGSQDIEDATTGNGGSGGNAGLGGAVQTGDATAVTSVTNQANTNIVRLDGCACDNTYSRVRVRTHDFAFLMNRTGTAANTGDNAALGSYAGSGGDGGEVENGSSMNPHILSLNHNNNNNSNDGEQELDNVTTGTGGNGGTGDAGGSVLTGAATARATIVNLTNSNRIRIR